MKHTRLREQLRDDNFRRHCSTAPRPETSCCQNILSIKFLGVLNIFLACIFIFLENNLIHFSSFIREKETTSHQTSWKRAELSYKKEINDPWHG